MIPEITPETPDAIMRNCVRVRSVLNTAASTAFVAPMPYSAPEPFSWKQYRDDDGKYHRDGCDYDDFRDFILQSVFDFCGCGALYCAAEFIRDGLQYFKTKEAITAKHQTAEDWSAICKELAAEEERVFGSRGSAMLFFYVLDSKDLTEHGGSVPGWLNEKGEALLEELTEFLKGEE
jgi:hypothetical protein